MKLLEFFEDGGGQLSSVRLAFLFWTITVLAVWAIVSIQAGKIQSIDWSVVGIIFTLMTGKVVQSYSASDAGK